MYLLFWVITFSIVGGELVGRYTRDVKNYDVVVPQKVSENGGFVSYYLPHFYNVARVRRGADSGRVYYVVPIEGANRMLELLPSEDFHAPGMVIEHHENDARLSVSTVKIRRPRKLNCYYHGWVKGEPSSSAAITACSGLAGAISIGSDHYMIEPVDENEAPTVDPKHMHILYKRDHNKQIYNRSICGTKGDFATAFEERMKWEEEYGEETEKIMMGEVDSSFTHGHSNRSKRWCTTCKPKKYIKCQTPYPPCIIERPLFLETAIVIGPRAAADKYIFSDMEQFINTIINIAVKHFQDSSLERPILIKLVRVITLGFMYEDLDPYRYDPEDLLKRFCEWQMHFNPKREVHPNHHDFVLYLVRFGDCKGSMQGLTNMASVCRPDKACGVVSLEGLLTGHVITHMMGHSMGADHDDENLSGCSPEEPDGTCYHMSQHICTRSTTWSICSKQCISKFTSTHAAWCMSDIPTAHDMTDPTLLPGQVYSAAEQCRINFEMDTYACLVGEFCKHLFCKVSDTECMSTGEPPAQGTRCGPDQWCFNQRCVHRGSRPGAVNGEWGIWSQWTPCTKTCGGGVQTANRACDSPPPSNGGRKCTGPWMKSRMCNIAACPDAGKGFLDQQCKNTNTRLYHGRRHEWLYFNQQVEELQCVVMCINERNEVAVRAPLAIDGTFCTPGAKDVCIRGVCQPVGCDWVIGSKAKEDACGVCHGNGTECRVMQGYFTEQNFQGRMPFLKLPIGTSMILMRETRPSPCFFVIANSLNSTYYLNSDDAEERVAFTGAFLIQFTVGIYQLKANMERIFIKDPLRVPITVSVLCRNLERSIGILYQYALPEPNNPNEKAHYTWEFLSWGRCPHACGGAVQRATPVCVEAQGGEVEDSYCATETRPTDRIRVCNPRPCKAKWWVGPWSDCDCYQQDGVKTRMVMCAHMKAARSSYISLVTEEECLGEDKPISEKPCGKDAETRFWANKGERKKRDFMDLVPYRKEIEDYSVWDEIPEDLASVNVREVFQAMDPENVEDYAYMKKVGMTPSLWEKVQRQAPSEYVRRRKALTTPGRTKPEKEKVTQNNNQNRPKFIKLESERVNEFNQQNKYEEPSKKERSEPGKKTRPKNREHHKTNQTENSENAKLGTDRFKTDRASKTVTTTEIYRDIDHKKFAVPTELKHKEKHTNKHPTHRRNGENMKKQISLILTENDEVRSKNIEKHHKSKDAAEIEVRNNLLTPSKTQEEDGGEDVINKSKRVNVTLKHVTQAREKKLQVGAKGAPEKSTGLSEKTKKYLLMVDPEMKQVTKPTSMTDTTRHTVDDLETTCLTETPCSTETTRKDEKTTTANSLTTITAKSQETVTTGVTTGHQSSITIPEVKIAPGLTPYTMYATETANYQGECWKKEIKAPRSKSTCRPKEDAVDQPADDAPEWDFVNTSNVKIYVVPIQTTLRTIIQNDNEYVLMETLAKYPVADEMSMIEHTGDAARRKLKMAADRKVTSRPHVQD